MNTISWIIYLSFILPNLSIFLIMAPIIVLFLLGMTCFMTEGFDFNEESTKKKAWFWFKFIIFLTPFLFITGLLIPDQKTILLIAGSEGIEEIAKNPEARELGDAVYDRLIDMLKPEITNEQTN